jgi:hypothetical protein
VSSTCSLPTDDLWVADNPIFGHYDYYFFLNAVIMLLGYIAFLLVTRNYEEKPVINADRVSCQ